MAYEAKKGGKPVKGQSADDTKLVGEIDTYISTIDSNRQFWLRDGFVNLNYLEGRHRVQWNSQTNRITLSPIQQNENEIRLDLAFMRKQLRGLKNALSRNDFKVEVRNSPSQFGTPKERRVARMVINNDINSFEFRNRLSDLMDYGFIKSWGLISTLPDDDISVNGKIEHRVYDPFECYPDNKPYIHDWRFLILTMSKPIEELKESKLYNSESNPYRDNLNHLTGDSRASENMYQNNFMQTYGSSSVKVLDSVILKQCFKLENEIYKDGDDEVDEEGNVTKEAGKKERMRIRLCVSAGGFVLRSVLLPEWYTNLDQIFTMYVPERRAGMLYPRAWLTELQEINRSLDRNASNLETYDHLFSKGRFLKEINTEVTAMVTDNGQEIVYDGIKPEFQPAAPLNAGSMQLFDMVERVGEDIGGIHSDSMGRVSGSASSGVAIKYLQAADMNNISTPVENLRITLSDVARNVLFVVSHYYEAMVKIYDNKKSNAAIPAVGANSALAKLPLGEDVTKVHSFENVKVDVLPGTVWNDMQAADDLFELRKAGVMIPDKYILEAYAFGNTADIIDDMQREQEEKVRDQNPDMTIADGENQKMMLGQNVTVNPSDDHEIHLAIHGALLQNMPKNNPAYPIVLQHAQEHQAALQAVMQKQNPTQQQVQAPSVSM